MEALLCLNRSDAVEQTSQVLRSGTLPENAKTIDVVLYSCRFGTCRVLVLGIPGTTQTHRLRPRVQEGTGKGACTTARPPQQEAKVQGQKPEGARIQTSVDLRRGPRGDPGAPPKYPQGPGALLAPGPPGLTTQAPVGQKQAKSRRKADENPPHTNINPEKKPSGKNGEDTKTRKENTKIRRDTVQLAPDRAKSPGPR